MPSTGKGRVLGRIILIGIVGLITCIGTNAQETVVNQTFRAGEQLSYALTYKTVFGEILAGKAKVKIDAYTGENFQGEEQSNLYHVIAEGKTNNFFDFFFKVRDHFESYIDKSTLLPVRFTSHTHEGKYVFSDDVLFDRTSKMAVSKRNEVSVPESIHDILSSVYFLRTVTLDDFGPDSTFYFDFFLDDSVYHSKVIFLGRETLDTDWGKITCLKVMPMMATGEVFAKRYPMIMWITDDRNHIPVRAESEIIVGSVVMKLVDFRNLKNPFTQSLAVSE